MKTIPWSLAVLLSFVVPARAAVRSEVVEYREGTTTLQGFLVHDPAAKGPRPGLVLVPDWLGVSEHARQQAERLATMGYTVLVADIYGKGVRPADARAASAESGKYYGNRTLVRARAQAALDRLTRTPGVDAHRLGALGYCFGGMVALELARSGAPLGAVVTFHGSLASASPADARNIKAKVLVLHGADDPYVKQSDVTAFMDEMRAAHVDWQLVQYSGAVHSFTDDRAGMDNAKGAAYNAVADRRSWRAMTDFLAETLAAH